MTDATKNTIRKWMWIVVTVPVVLLLVLLTAVWLFADIPSFKELESPNNKLATQIIDENGRQLTTFHIENRTYVTYEEISPYLVEAAISTEDARFYQHSGIDLRSLGRVAVKTLLFHNASQGGGSTITQQLAKTLYPREDMQSKVPGVKAVKMVWVKLKEWVTAVKLERSYTKDEIITMYFNSIYFGSNSFGIKAATETFFGKEPSEVDVQEAATLVGMVNKPTRYNPVINPDKSLARRNFVLGRMCKSDFIEDDRLDSLIALPIELDYHVQDHNSGIAPYFRDMLRRTMSAKMPERSSYRQYEDYLADSLLWADDQLYGWLNKNKKADGSQYNLDKDGLRIHTTINYNMQKYAEEAVAEHLGMSLQRNFDSEMRWVATRPYSEGTDPKIIESSMKQARRWSDRWRMMKNEGKTDAEIVKSFGVKTPMKVFQWKTVKKDGKLMATAVSVDTVMTPNDSILYYKGIIRASFMAIEPVTGEVKAYVGGPSYRYFKYDNVRQGKRQVGSTAKPFLYTLAMQEGMSPCDRVVNVPQTFDLVGAEEETWTPKSTDKNEWIGQSVTLKWGLMKSSNNISAYLMKQFGPGAMVQMMRRMGITSYLEEVYSLCVGSCDLSLYEMVPAYNTFPSGGVYVAPLLVTSIEDNMGNVLSTFVTRKHEAISEHSAYLMENLMAGVVNAGTAVRLRSMYALQGDIAGKTGTNNDQADGWFIGYTPKITAGVWVGAEDRQVHFRTLSQGGGSVMALPIWGIFMKKCMADPTLNFKPTDRFVAPANFEMNLDCGEDMMEVADGTCIGANEDEEDNYFD